MEHLKATLLEIGGYSESKAEQYINNVRQKILLYETKYMCLISSNSEKKTEDHTTYDVFFPKRRIAKKRRINTLEYELDLYEREPLENFENENNDIETNLENNGLLSWKLLSKRFPILVTNDRANLNENTVSSIILMHSWLKESQKKSSPLEDLPEAK
ncbi:15560_t:CDS:2 [Gigaspora rosea]|nr:15560_t:CDS:2 [Gigaspora rosea]